LVDGLDAGALRGLCCVLLADCLGGPELVDMLVRYHQDRATYRELAEVHGMTVRGAIKRLENARAELRRLGIMPAAWESAGEPDGGVETREL
jgi:hypothetical protein